MIPQLVNHLWQSTLFAVAAAMLAFALRKSQACVRYWLWLSASLKFLVPFSLMVAAGSYFAPRTTASIAQPVFSEVAGGVSRAFTAPVAPIPVVQPASNPIPTILLVIWVCGFLAVMGCWCVRWLRVGAVARAARPLASAAGMPVLSSPALLEPGVFGIFRPVLLLPEGIMDHLTREQLDAIITHELCHVRRRDNLAAAMHMLVEALFWFHPLVWWIGTRLIEERERACDEEVLRRGSKPQVYAESILRTCEFYLESPLACMSGVTGADLKKRIVRIMTLRVAQKLGRWRKVLLASFGTAAIAGPLAFGLMNPLHSRAQSQPAAKESFEVASIKPNKSGTGDSYWRDYRKSGRVITTNVALRDYIERAYGVRSYQITGPDWIKSARYDLNAEAPPGMLTEPRLQSMLQELLTERFGLVLHREEKTLPVYELVVAKGGPKLQEGKHGQGGISSNTSSHRGYMAGKNASMSELLDSLSRRVDRPVVDKTGLKGVYNFTLQWTPENMRFMPSTQTDANSQNGDDGPSIFTAIQEQLGLKLVPRKDPVEILVIDHLNNVPTEN